jgi:hypothetical protein
MSRPPSRQQSRPSSARPGSRPASALSRKITTPSPDAFLIGSIIGPITKSSKIYAKEIPGPKNIPPKRVTKTVRASTAPVNSTRKLVIQQQDVIETRPMDLAKQNIIIHVYDESKSAKRAFHCKRNLLVREMEYFEAALKGKVHHAVVEIDVHCDIEVFEWLMGYISRQKPGLDPRLGELLN